MRAPWQKLCLLLLVLCLLSTVAMAGKKSKKNKKSSQKTPSKDTSPSEDRSKGKSAKEEAAVNPKMKPAQMRAPKKKPANGSLDTPIIREEILVVQVPAAHDTQVFTKTGHPSSDNCSSPLQDSGSLKELEKDVTSLWTRVGALSQPVHIHVHGGHVSPSSNHGRQGCKGRCHGDGSHKRHRESKDKDKPRPARGDDFNATEHYGSANDSSSQESHQHHSARRHHDHSHKSHHHHSHKSHDHSHKSHRHHSHKSHHHHSHEQPTDNLEGHNDFRHHGHSPRVDRGHGHDLEHHRNSSKGGRERGGEGHTKHRGHENKSGRGGHSLYRGHGQGRGRNLDESRGHSTHVHIHVTVDEKPGHHDPRQPEAKAASDDDVLHARCDIRSDNYQWHLEGYVLLRQQNETLEVKVNITGFPPGLACELTDDPNAPSTPPRRLHGFHVHEFGDFSKGCLSFGAHYNPESVHHGGLEHDHRHVGDWGNLEVNDEDVALAYFSVTDATLIGRHSIVGRGIVIHGQADDLGQGDTEASKASGNAGTRLACCVVARSQPGQDDELWSSP